MMKGKKMTGWFGRYTLHHTAHPECFCECNACPELCRRKQKCIEGHERKNNLFFKLALCLIIALSSPLLNARENMYIHSLHNFDRLINKYPFALVCFYEETRAIKKDQARARELNNLLATNREIADTQFYREGDLKVLNCNISRHKLENLADEYGIKQIPSYMLFKYGSPVTQGMKRPKVDLKAARLARIEQRRRERLNKERKKPSQLAATKQMIAQHQKNNAPLSTRTQQTSSAHPINNVHQTKRSSGNNHAIAQLPGPVSKHQLSEFIDLYLNQDISRRIEAKAEARERKAEAAAYYWYTSPYWYNPWYGYGPYYYGRPYGYVGFGVGF
jgi:hypothetical protein